MGLWYGLHMGAYQAFSRAIFATLIPSGKERCANWWRKSAYLVVKLTAMSFTPAQLSLTRS